ncbi:unnamed protein product [Cyberlindnera jadinii]|uniref:Uncharacterized protein n=1 Tax=Cyberlindnera jadinii (strain ATCC 18201 / CBS 1600 / BCRC 20928 / JCM 3617 / NBRC 0987 / NRRL Y-1542) TaxID=983966 RepID=A0A0H5C6E7_CYBJN|nr:unnamed protein product [Cyberlindnera jadinii]
MALSPGLKLHTALNQHVYTYELALPYGFKSNDVTNYTDRLYQYPGVVFYCEMVLCGTLLLLGINETQM